MRGFFLYASLLSNTELKQRLVFGEKLRDWNVILVRACSAVLPCDQTIILLSLVEVTFDQGWAQGAGC